jgi:hypothetical protein
MRLGTFFRARTHARAVPSMLDVVAPFMPASVRIASAPRCCGPMPLPHHAIVDVYRAAGGKGCRPRITGIGPIVPGHMEHRNPSTNLT